jgi:guanylate kinase
MSKLLVISGPSGVGKGTIVKHLQDKYEEEGKKLYLSISCTTRNPREGEKDGVNYFFITEEEFKEKIKQNDFLEYNVYGTGKYYGTPKSTVVKYLNEGYDVILEIDINGYKQIKANYPDSVGVFIMPPDIKELYNRLKNRNTETEDVIQVRLETAKKEIRGRKAYDYIVVNENGKSEEASEEIYNIINRR